MDKIDKTVIKELEKLKNQIEQSQKELEKLPRGTIFIKKVGKSSFVYRKRKENGKVISTYLGKSSDDKVKKEIKKSVDYHELQRKIKLMTAEYNYYQKKKNLANNLSDVLFAVNIAQVDGKMPSRKAIELLKLLNDGTIDLETYQFAIGKLYKND